VLLTIAGPTIIESELPFKKLDRAGSEPLLQMSNKYHSYRRFRLGMKFPSQLRFASEVD
jgi:hypothetical protein